MTDSSILVTGGAGYIGSHAALSLLDAGRRVVIIDDLSTGSRSAVPEGALFIEGDIGDTDLVQKILRQQWCASVMHFAGSVVVSESVEQPLSYYRNNTAASLGLLQACVAEAVDNIIFSSTAAVYGAQTDETISESAATGPVSPYGQSKLMIESMIADASRAHGFNYVILRYFNVAGADPKGRSGQVLLGGTHIFANAIRAALGKAGKIKIYGDDYDTADGTCIRDFIHVSDLADIHLSALRHLEDNGGRNIMNCGYGKGYSVRQVIDIINAQLDTPVSTCVVERRAGDIVTAVADTARLNKTLSWHQNHDIQSIAKTALDWARRVDKA